LCVDRFKGEAKLAPSERVLVEKDGTKHSLTIKQVAPKDAGSYSCKATNAVGTAAASAKLNVRGQ